MLQVMSLQIISLKLDLGNGKIHSVKLNAVCVFSMCMYVCVFVYPVCVFVYH